MCCTELFSRPPHDPDNFTWDDANHYAASFMLFPAANPEKYRVVEAPAKG
jgi:hypothetical protein